MSDPTVIGGGGRSGGGGASDDYAREDGPPLVLPRSSAPPYAWRHTDERGIGVAIQQAGARARARAWSSDAPSVYSQGTRDDDARALLVNSAWAFTNLSLEPARIESGALAINLDCAFASDDARKTAFSAVFAGWAREARTKGTADSVAKQPLRVQTSGQSISVETGNPALLGPLAIVGIRAVTLLGAAVITGVFAAWAGPLIHNGFVDRMARRDGMDLIAAGEAMLADVEHLRANRAYQLGKPVESVPYSEREKETVSRAKEMISRGLSVVTKAPEKAASPTEDFAWPIALVGGALGALYLATRKDH